MISTVTILGTSTAISEFFLLHLRYFVISHLSVIVPSSGFRLTVNALHEHNGGKNPFIAELFEEMDIDILDFQVTAHTVST